MFSLLVKDQTDNGLCRNLEVDTQQVSLSTLALGLKANFSRYKKLFSSYSFFYISVSMYKKDLKRTSLTSTNEENKSQPNFLHFPASSFFSLQLFVGLFTFFSVLFR
jgi:hypothetical protein